MATMRIRYYSVINGNGFFRPSAKMRASGAKAVPCGPDGPIAWDVARRAYEAWKAGVDAEARRQPRIAPGSFGYAFTRYRQTEEWRKKEPRTREEWDRCWTRIEPLFGRARPNSVTLEHISMFREGIAKDVSEREAHRCIKIWRALWQVAAAFKLCKKDEDPSFGISNTEPPTRTAVWEHAEVIKLAKTAWRGGYKGLAAVIAVSWDTSLSPVDVRSLRPQDLDGDTFSVARAKTGQAAVGTLQRRALRTLDAYIASLGVDLAPNAPIFRTPGFTPTETGGRPWASRPYTKDKLEKDFAKVRALAFGPKERRTLADFRRSGTVEAIRGGAADSQIAAKMANQFDRSSFLRKTYAPVDLAAVREADKARKRARK